MGPDHSGKKFAEVRHPYDPETTLLHVEVTIGNGGGGGVSASFFQDRGPTQDREGNAALLRQAAQMMLEHADNVLNRPPLRPPE